MNLSAKDKENIKKRIVENLRSKTKIYRIIVFGSFLHEDNPNDIDLAIFQNSKENYLNLSLKYRKAIREISRKIPVDIFPIKTENVEDLILSEIESGEVIFERKY